MGLNPLQTNVYYNMENTVFIVYKTDAHHSYASRDIIGISDSLTALTEVNCGEIKSAIMICLEQADKEGGEIGEDQLFNLRNIKQTQGYFGDGEFQIEEVELNTLL